jgi:hypothetical protein
MNWKQDKPYADGIIYSKRRNIKDFYFIVYERYSIENFYLFFLPN